MTSRASQRTRRLRARVGAVGVLLAALLSGCGRLGFEPSEDAGGLGAPSDDAGVEAGVLDATGVTGTTDATRDAVSSDAIPDAPAADVGPDAERIDAGSFAPAFVLYTFQEGSGSLVRDRGAGGEELDLVINDLGQVEWEADGLRTLGDAALEGAVPSRLVDSIQASGALSIEAWLVPTQTIVSGPSRILTCSPDRFSTNVTLGQGGSDGSTAAAWSARLRTTELDYSGFETGDGTAALRLTHVVFVRRADGAQALWIDGATLATNASGGNFGNWDTSFPLTVANERGGGRPWLGLLRRVALYDRALPPNEITARFAAGPPGPP